jgi:hypothetical protein
VGNKHDGEDGAFGGYVAITRNFRRFGLSDGKNKSRETLEPFVD